jgi:hypothetical protein
MKKLRTLAELVQDMGTVAAAARYLDITYGTLKRWQTGANVPSRAMIQAARYKGIDLTYGLAAPQYVQPIDGQKLT